MNVMATMTTMSSREIAELTGSRHDTVKRSVERCAESGTITQPPSVVEQNMDVKGRKRDTSVYLLDKRSSLIVVAQIMPEVTGRIVDRWQELEAQVRQPTLQITLTRLEMAKLLVESEERAANAETAARAAIETKALIGHKREATAMAVASNANQKAKRLEAELGRSRDYMTIKAVENFTGDEFQWRPLRDYCKAHELEVIRVEEPLYGKVNGYPAAAWLQVYAINTYEL